MAEPIADLESLLTAVRAVQHVSLKEELGALRREAAWARTQLPIQEGDSVRIVARIPTDNGWHPFREALAVGATGTVTRLNLSSTSNTWRADVVLDRCWSYAADLQKRFWRGAAADTPTGYEPPAKFDQEHYPDGKPTTFALRLEWLAKIPSLDSEEIRTDG